MTAFLERPRIQLEGIDQAGWPEPDMTTETELSLMYSALVADRRAREQAIAQAEMPSRPIVI